MAKKYTNTTLKNKAVRHSFYKKLFDIACSPESYKEDGWAPYTLRGLCHLVKFASDDHADVYSGQNFPNTLPELFLFRPQEPEYDKEGGIVCCCAWDWPGFDSNRNWDLRKTFLLFCIEMTR